MTYRHQQLIWTRKCCYEHFENNSSELSDSFFRYRNSNLSVGRRKSNMEVFITTSFAAHLRTFSWVSILRGAKFWNVHVHADIKQESRYLLQKFSNFRSFSKIIAYLLMTLDSLLMKFHAWSCWSDDQRKRSRTENNRFTYLLYISVSVFLFQQINGWKPLQFASSLPAIFLAAQNFISTRFSSFSCNPQNL